MADLRHNLPVPLTPLIGREREVRAVCDLLARADVHLVTLTGPGGTGKTRVGLKGATESLSVFADGAVFVDLAPIRDPTLVLPTTAKVLGVHTPGNRTIMESLTAHLRDRCLLLVLDNFEQILLAAHTLVDLLGGCPRLKMLVTSRAALQVRGEHELQVPPLPVPDLTQPPSTDIIRHFAAVELFVDRARSVRADFRLTDENAQAVATICTRLDGLPLAVELAAARIRLLPPEGIVGRLERRLQLLTAGPHDLPARHHTLRDTIAWSYDLLDPSEQRAFRSLAVFIGGFTLDAAEAVLSPTDEGSVAALDLVEQLVSRSLMRQIGMAGNEPRFGMLETIREFALEQLEAHQETARLRDRHLRWCHALAERGDRGWRGADMRMWIDRFEDEHDNFRTALEWAERSGDPAHHGLQLAIIARRVLWSIRGHHREGRAWVKRLLPHAPPRSRPRADALVAGGYLALRQDDYADASAAFGEALEIYREIGDQRGIAETLQHFGVVPHHLGDYDAARTMLEESLTISRALGDSMHARLTLRALADLYRDTGADAAAISAYEEALAGARVQGDDHEIAYCLRGLGHVARTQGQYARAEELLKESLALLKPLGDRRCTPLSLEGLACITVGPDWAERAARLLGAAQVMQASVGTSSPPSSMADYQRTVADARQELGTAHFDAAWATGATLDLDAAIDLALATPRHDTSDVRRQPTVPLSRREQEVVTLITQGFSNRQISDRLVLSVRTVERHIENVYNRLGITGKAGRAIVTAYAIRHGLVTLSSDP